MIVVLLGPPGAGKGTQAARLAQANGWHHLSTGDLFRDHLRRTTPLGVAAREFMDRGDLVPDDLVTKMVAEAMSAGGGFVLDGFPRTLPQARALDEIAPVDLAVLIEVPDEVLFGRLTGRRVCSDGSHVYHIPDHPPRQDGVCDLDGSPLVQRQDDSPETVTRRLEVFERETRPVIEYYRTGSRIRFLDGTGSVDDVAARLVGEVAILQSAPG
jgi:adenylate kinase